MAILRFWCPKHHTSRTNTAADNVLYGDDAVMYARWRQKVGVVQYKFVEPVCPVCREKMVRIQKMPKRRKSQTKRSQVRV